MTPLARALPSRIQGPHKILKQLRTLHDRTWSIHQRNDRAINRCETPDEQRWCARAGDALEEMFLMLQRVIREGDAVLPVKVDPRDQRKVRKRNITKK